MMKIHFKLLDVLCQIIALIIIGSKIHGRVDSLQWVKYSEQHFVETRIIWNDNNNNENYIMMWCNFKIYIFIILMLYTQ